MVKWIDIDAKNAKNIVMASLDMIIMLMHVRWCGVGWYFKRIH